MHALCRDISLFKRQPCYNLLERQIDGEAIVDLTREDFSVIYPSNEQFLVGSRLYKIVKNARSAGEYMNTDSLLEEMDDVTGATLCSTSPPTAEPSASVPVSTTKMTIITVFHNGQSVYSLH